MSIILFDRKIIMCGLQLRHYVVICASLFRQKQAVKKQANKTKNKNKSTAREINTIPAATLRIHIAIGMI